MDKLTVARAYACVLRVARECSVTRAFAAAALLLVLSACDAPGRAQTSATAGGAGAVLPAGAGVRVCRVARVIDGDTLVCDDGVRVRLLLIDAPELSQGPFGAAAKRELEALAGAGTLLSMEYDVQRRDRYRRTLAYLYLPDGRMVNEELLRAGMAVVAVYPPNVRHVDRLRAAVAEARAAEVGLWATSAFECEPREYRAGRC